LHAPRYATFVAAFEGRALADTRGRGLCSDRDGDSRPGKAALTILSIRSAAQL